MGECTHESSSNTITDLRRILGRDYEVHLLGRTTETWVREGPAPRLPMELDPMLRIT